MIPKKSTTLRLQGKFCKMCYNFPMSEQTLQYQKTYSIDILDRARDDGNDCIVYFFMAELTYLKVPEGMTLVMIYPYDWSHSMTPWEYVPTVPPAPNAKGAEFENTGGGREFANAFCADILKPIEASLQHSYAKRYIGGYSLGGLMALYMATVLNDFDGCASCSGSFWYPGALSYFKEYPFAAKISRVYFSLGSKEAMTMHPERCQVEDNTRELLANTRLQGITDTTLVMHDGGHFHQIPNRIIAALEYLRN